MLCYSDPHSRKKDWFPKLLRVLCAYIPQLSAFFKASSVEENTLVQSHASFLDGLHPINDCPQSIKVWPSFFFQLWAALRDNFVFRFSYRVSWDILHRQHWSLTSLSAQFCLMPFPSAVENPESTLLKNCLSAKIFISECLFHIAFSESSKRRKHNEHCDVSILLKFLPSLTKTKPFNPME